MQKLLLIFSFFLFSANCYAAIPAQGFADLAEKLIPAVVNISATQAKDKNADEMEEVLPFKKFPPGHPFEEFNDLFEKFGNNGPKNGSPGRKAVSLGSGFIIDPSGIIVTNNHVIATGEDITVNLSDGTKIKAKVIGKDAKMDVALLKVDTNKSLPYVTFGNSDRSRVGDFVIAIGNPFGLGGTVTAGIISARARDINAGPFDDFIQTDAAINRGNSGGPMFNMDGEVIGINTAIFSPTGGSVGIGFAVPSNLAQPIIKQLRAEGKVRRSMLGVKIQSVTEEVKESLGLPEERGALVVDVNKDSPAKKAGIIPGDVILKFDNKEVNEMRKLPRIVAETPIGKTVDIELWRSGVKKYIKVTLVETQEREEVKTGKLSKGGKSQPSQIESKEIQGLKLAVLNDMLRSEYDIATDVKGLIVIDANGRTKRQVDLFVGDVLIEVNQRPLNKISDFQNAIDEAKSQGKKSILLLVMRAGETLFVPFPISDK